LELLQEGIMIISRKNDKKNLNQSLSKSVIAYQENDFKVEFMNSVFKNMVGFPT
jgi:hypothetical protein